MRAKQVGNPIPKDNPNRKLEKAANIGPSKNVTIIVESVPSKIHEVRSILRLILLPTKIPTNDQIIEDP